MFDLDHFKEVNDTNGHNIGDHVLRAVAQLVSDSIRAHDILTRWGGEEFMVLIPKTNQNQAGILAEKLRRLIEAHDFGNGLHVTASFGVTQFRDSDHADTFTARSDSAMYLAKENGRNRIESL
jgi:diguanylate cyclase (GGDEF)-like protein